ncbi:MAG: NepR family anti-sigma factor [Pontixanthobacter sp.]
MGEETGNKPGGAGGSAKPDWANGLRQLYDSVVDEPIPDSFQDLLSKLDDDKSGRS